MPDDEALDRRSFVKLAGGAAASAALAGCGGDGEDTPEGDGGDTATDGMEETATDRPEPEDREGYLQRANLLLHERAPWVFLNRQFSVYGQNSDLDWDARRDELIAAVDIGPGDDGSVTITQGQMDSGLDPHDHRETPTDNIVTQAHDGVLNRNASGEVIEGLATEYERLEEGLVEFTLRDGVTFHNGDDLAASDVAFSVNRIVDPEVGDLESPQSDQLAGVTGAEATEDLTVEVSSDGINPIVFQEFASYCDVVQEDWITERETSEINTDMNGTGPFRVTEYESDVRVEYEAFEDYWDGEPEVAELTMNAASEASTRVSRLLADESDIVVNVPPEEVQRVQDDDTTEVEAVPSTRVIFNAMRYDAEPFSSQQFRQAMNYAIDLDSIIENVLAGFAAPTGQPTLEGFVGYNPDVGPYDHDPDTAEQLVEESGHAGADITLETPVGRYLKDLEIAQAVAEYIDDLENVSCSVEQREFESLVGELTTGNIEDKPPFYLIGWGNTTFDATQTIIPLLTTGGALTSYEEDEDVDSAIEQAQSLPGGE
jgi:peptide/nickel transport system substrate-binding protein